MSKEKTISFLQGFSISILNPKILVWFITVYLAVYVFK